MNNNYVINDPLAVIYNEGYWRLSKVSPIFNLQSSTVKLKQYASKIRHSLVSTIQTKSGNKISVVFEEHPHLKYDINDPVGLMISVSSNENNRSKLVYTGIFLSWGVSMKVPGAIHLPFMLEHGEQRIGTSVKMTFQNLFDCTINQFCFTQLQMLQIGFKCVENDTSRATDPFTLCYEVPADHKVKMRLTFEVGDVGIIWQGIQNGAMHISDKVTIAYQILQNQIFYTVMLDVTPLDLIEINLNRAEVKLNGTVKMKTLEMVNSVLTVLNEVIKTQSLV